MTATEGKTLKSLKSFLDEANQIHNNLGRVNRGIRYASSGIRNTDEVDHAKEVEEYKAAIAKAKAEDTNHPMLKTLNAIMQQHQAALNKPANRL